MKRGRPTYRDTLLQAKAGNDLMADLAGKPRLDYSDLIRPKRGRAAPKPTGIPLEKDVLIEVLQALRAHPAVAWVARINSGTFKEGQRYVRANSQRGMSDILAMTTAGRLIACEVKRPGGHLEPHQAEFIGTINANGGLAFMATSAADVLRIMEERNPRPLRI